MKRFYYFLTLLLALPPALLLAQAGAVDLTFNPGDVGFGNGDGANGAIRAIVLQPDGKVLIAGQFTNYNGIPRNGMARLNADGTLDYTFNPGIGANGITNMAIQPDEKILIGGTFDAYNGTTRNRIARVNADGTLDVTFNPGTGTGTSSSSYYNVVNAIVLQSDGKIVITGGFDTYSSITRNGIARLNSDGTLDLTFNPGIGVGSYVNGITLQLDGKILIVGDFTTYNGVARLNADGTLDLTFIPGIAASGSVASGSVNDVILQPDGKILIVGDFTSYNGTTRRRIARLNTDGTLDFTFNPSAGANNSVETIALQPDGKILIGGAFTFYNTIRRNRIARLDANGGRDDTFNPWEGANSSVLSIALQPDGKIIIGGVFTAFNDVIRNRIARLANLDNFNPGTGADSEVRTISFQPDGKIFIGGDFTSYNGTTRRRIARLNPDGSLDTTFNPGSGVNNAVETMALQPDGKILIGGGYTAYNGTLRNYIARLNTDGTLDNTFNPGTGPNSSVSIITLQPDGKILIGGDFSSYNGTTRNRIARLNTDGTLDITLNPSTGPNNIVNAITLQPDGKILIGGEFTFYNGTSRNHIARLNSGGTLDNTFNPGNGANSWVETIALQSDGKILIGGWFSSFNNTSRGAIARLNADGTIDNTFNSGTGADDWIFDIALQSDGKVLLGGGFTNYNSKARNHIARVHSDGTLDSTFNPGTGANNILYDVTIEPDGNILIGGSFTAYNGIGRNRIARIFGTNSTLCPGFSIDLGPDTLVVCNQDSALLNAGTGFEGYFWNTGDTTQSVVAYQSGWYRVTVSQQGCTASDSVFVNLNGFDIRAPDSLVCPGHEMSLSLISKVNGPGNGVYPANYAPTQNLLGWWDFKGNAQDRSSNANHGTVNGAILTYDRFGNANAAYSFDGIDDYIETTNAIPITGNAPRSVSVWFSLSSFNPGWNTLLNFGQPCPNAGTSNSLQVDNLTRLIFKANGYNDDASFAPVVANRWYHFVWTFDGSLSRIYLDGVLIPNDYSNVPKTLATTLTTLKIGFDYSSLSCNSFHHQFNRPFKGSIDEIGIWSRALSADEVYALYSGIPVNSTVLWSTGDTTQTIAVTPAQTTTYYCTVSDAFGSCTDSVTVHVNPIPQVDLGPDTLLVCGQDSLYLDTGSGFDSYLWNTGDTTSGIWVTHSNQYWVTIEQGGCVASDSLYVQILDSRIRGYSGTVTPDATVVLYQDTSAFVNVANQAPIIPNYTYQTTRQDRYVYTSNTTMYWNNARDQANQLGGEMAYVKNVADNQFFTALRNTVSLTEYWFLGASDEVQEGYWKWNDGTPMIYTNWSYTMPDNAFGSQHYLHLYSDGTWDDIHITYLMRNFLLIPIPQRPQYLWSTGDTTASIQLSSRTDTLVWCTVTQSGFSCTDTLLVEVEAERRIGTMDLEEHRYTSLVLNNLEWMDRNYAGAHFANRDSIAEVSNNAQWSSLNAPGAGSIPGNALNDSLYGKLYNGLAATDSRGLCPYGWRVATDTDWQNLVDYVGDSTTAGGHLKDPLYWTPTNAGATNLFDFSARGAGYRHFQNGLYDRKDLIGYWWSPESGDTTSSLVKIRRIRRQNTAVDRYDSPKAWGYSCRCVRDAAVEVAMPSVSTDAIINIDDTRFTVSVSVQDAGNDPNLRYGFVYSTQPNPTLLDEVVDANGGMNQNVEVIGLTPNTTYYVRAFAWNAAGYEYGTEVPVLTTDCGQPAGVPVLSNLSEVNPTKYEVSMLPVAGDRFRLE